MRVNLHGYVELTLKYILLFQTTSNEQLQDYMVFETLKSTRIKNFLETCASISPTERTLCDTRECAQGHYTKNMKQMNEYTGYSTTYVSKIFHDRGIKNKSYQDIIRDECDTSFKIISVPFSKATFEKIYYLSAEKDTVFTNDEICLIFTHLFPHNDDVLLLLSWTICLHLQNNPIFLQELLDIARYPGRSSSSQQLKHLSTIVTGTSERTRIFRAMVNSSMIPALKDESERPVMAHKMRVNYMNFWKKFTLDELMIACLIEKLTISYDRFASKCDILNEKFEGIMAKSSLVVTICDIYSNGDSMKPELISESKILRSKLAFISECKFLQNECIREVVLEFNGTQSQLKPGILNGIRNLSTVMAKSVSVDFVKSICDDVKNVEVVFSNKLPGSVCDIPQTVK